MTDSKEEKQEKVPLLVSVPPLKQTETDVVEYGFLKNLEGKWVNTDGDKLGYNIVSVPGKGTLASGVDASFDVIAFDYKEVLLINKTGGALNRGGLYNQFNGIVEYNQIVTGSQDPKLPDSVQHIENGMFLFLDNISAQKGNNENKNDSNDTGVYKPTYNYCRSGTVPHGNSLLICGNETDVINGPPKFDDFADLLDPIDATMNRVDAESGLRGYTEKITVDIRYKPLATLKNAIKGQNIIKTQTLILSSKNNGAITSTQFIDKFVNISVMEMDFILWLETVKDDKTGTTFMQLQYAQRMIFHFDKTKKTHTIIKWPHITVNTLVWEPLPVIPKK